MLNKKLGLFVMSAAMLGLVACGGGNQPSTTTAQGDTTNPAGTTSQAGDTSKQEELPAIPEVEGKLAVYFTYVDFTYTDDAGEQQESIKLADLPDYCAPFITGNWNGYGTGLADGAQQMTQLEGTAVFYAYIDADADLGDLGYQITLGYSAASGVSSSKQGINWSYKTAYSDDYFPGLDHPVMTKLSDKLYVCASDKEDAPMGFKRVLAEPKVVTNPSIKFKMEVDAELEWDKKENLEFVVKGSFNDWQVQALDEADEEGYYTVNLGAEIIAGPFEFCFGVHNKLIGGMDDAYNFMKVESEEKTSGKGAVYTEELDEESGDVIAVSVSNYSLNILGTTAPNKVFDLGTFKNPAKMMKDGEVVAYELPSDEAPLLPHSVSFVLANTGETAVGETVIPHFVGAITGWSHVAMEVSRPGFEFVYTIPANTMFVGVEQEFKFSTGAWDGNEVAPANAEGLADGNFKFIPEVGVAAYLIEADLSALGSGVKIPGELSVPEEPALLPELFEVTFRVHNTNDEPAAVATVAGEFQDWDPTSSPLTPVNGEDNVFEAKFDFGGRALGSVVNFKFTNGTWAKSVGTGGENFKLYISMTNVYEFDADLTDFEGDIEFHVELPEALDD